MQQLVQHAKGGGDPSTWDPPFCGDMDIEIRRDGSWWHEGTAITRIELQRLFASILRCNGGQYFLVTPIEKVRIRVIDVPFVITACSVADDIILLQNNLGDSVTLDNNHALQLRGDAEKPIPYVHWQHGLYARMSHAVFYELCELALQQAPVDGRYGIRSAGQFFPLQSDDTT